MQMLGYATATAIVLAIAAAGVATVAALPDVQRYVKMKRM
jgi:hypothetical protein